MKSWYFWLMEQLETLVKIILPPAMKAPAEYLAPHVFEARRPRRELQPVVPYTAALHALEQALADAEKYKYLLMRALRRHADDIAPQPAAPEAIVLPMYPAAGQCLAA